MNISRKYDIVRKTEAGGGLLSNGQITAWLFGIRAGSNGYFFLKDCMIQFCRTDRFRLPGNITTG